jgi:hypothetical protein
LIQSEYGMTEEEYLSHTPREISAMVSRIVDRKSGYKVSELNQVSTFSDEQEAKIRKAREKRFVKKEK